MILQVPQKSRGIWSDLEPRFRVDQHIGTVSLMVQQGFVYESLDDDRNSQSSQVKTTCCCEQNAEASMGGAQVFTEKDTILAVKWCGQGRMKFSGKLMSMKYPSGN